MDNLSQWMRDNHPDLYNTEQANFALYYPAIEQWGLEARKDMFTVEDMLAAIRYGFQYHRDSMHNDRDVPRGNKLQWILGKFVKPEEWGEWLDRNDRGITTLDEHLDQIDPVKIAEISKRLPSSKRYDSEQMTAEELQKSITKNNGQE